MHGALNAISIVTNNVYAQHHLSRARCRLRLFHRPLSTTTSSATSQQFSTLPETCTRDLEAGSQKIVYDQSHEWTENDVTAYAELCKNMLAMGCRSIPDFTKETRVLSSSHNLSFLLLNLGDIEREPRLPGKAKIPGHLLQDGTCTILPNMPYQNPANVTILREATNFQYTTELAEKHQCIALISGQIGKENYSGSHPIACIVQADETTTIELLRDTDLEAKGKMWLLHSSTFRVIWGRMDPEKARVINPASGETQFLHEILPAGYEGNDETRAEVSAHVAASVTVRERIVAVNYNDI